jgi:predicted DNA-binding protein
MNEQLPYQTPSGQPHAVETPAASVEPAVPWTDVVGAAAQVLAANHSYTGLRAFVGACDVFAAARAGSIGKKCAGILPTRMCVACPHVWTPFVMPPLRAFSRPWLPSIAAATCASMTILTLDKQSVFCYCIQQPYTYSMIRTQIYLPDSLAQRIAFEAVKTNSTKARVVRELLEAGLRHCGGETAQEALRSLVRIGQRLKAQGPADLSSNLDNYLYEHD